MQCGMVQTQCDQRYVHAIADLQENKGFRAGPTAQVIKCKHSTLAREQRSEHLPINESVLLKKLYLHSSKLTS